MKELDLTKDATDFEDSNEKRLHMSGVLYARPDARCLGYVCWSPHVR